jgi:hypothetical protein
MNPTKTPGQDANPDRGRITNRLSLECDPHNPILARAQRKGNLAMSNILPREKQIEVLHHLVEGNTLRSTSRLTGVHRSTIMI